MNKQYKAVQFLLKNGVNPHLKDKDDKTTLMHIPEYNALITFFILTNAKKNG